MAIRVLVADDHDGARAGIVDIIRRSGEDWSVCSEAVDGWSAVRLAIEHNPDLVILDVRMPKLDGMQAALEIRARLPGIPILLYTLLATPALEAAAQMAGLEGVVPKPDTAALIAAMRRAVRRQQSGGIASPRDVLPT